MGKYNYYKDARGITRKYLMASDEDTPDIHRKRSIQREHSKCALLSCKYYKTCNHNQVVGEKVKCINYKTRTQND